MLVSFSSHAPSTAQRYLSISTHSRIEILPDFPAKSLVGQRFNSVLEAYTHGLRVYDEPFDLMERLLEYRYTQDPYYRHLIHEYLNNSYTSTPCALVYESDNPIWGACVVDGGLIGRNMLGKMMMKVYYLHRNE